MSELKSYFNSELIYTDILLDLSKKYSSTNCSCTCKITSECLFYKQIREVTESLKVLINIFETLPYAEFNKVNKKPVSGGIRSRIELIDDTIGSAMLVIDVLGRDQIALDLNNRLVADIIFKFIATALNFDYLLSQTPSIMTRLGFYGIKPGMIKTPVGSASLVLTDRILKHAESMKNFFNGFANMYKAYFNEKKENTPNLILSKLDLINVSGFVVYGFHISKQLSKHFKVIAPIAQAALEAIKILSFTSTKNFFAFVNSICGKLKTKKDLDSIEPTSTMVANHLAEVMVFDSLLCSADLDKVKSHPSAQNLGQYVKFFNDFEVTKISVLQLAVLLKSDIIDFRMQEFDDPEHIIKMLMFVQLFRVLVENTSKVKSSCSNLIMEDLLKKLNELIDLVDNDISKNKKVNLTNSLKNFMGNSKFFGSGSILITNNELDTLNEILVEMSNNKALKNASKSIPSISDSLSILNKLMNNVNDYNISIYNAFGYPASASRGDVFLNLCTHYLETCPNYSNLKYLNIMLEFYGDMNLFARKFHIEYINHLSKSAEIVLETIVANFSEFFYNEKKNLATWEYYQILENTDNIGTAASSFLTKIDLMGWQFAIREKPVHIGYLIKSEIEEYFIKDMKEIFDYLERNGPKAINTVVTFLKTLQKTHGKICEHLKLVDFFNLYERYIGEFSTSISQLLFNQLVKLLFVHKYDAMKCVFYFFEEIFDPNSNQQRIMSNIMRELNFFQSKFSIAELESNCFKVEPFTHWGTEPVNQMMNAYHAKVNESSTKLFDTNIATQLARAFPYGFIDEIVDHFQNFATTIVSKIAAAYFVPIIENFKANEIAFAQFNQNFEDYYVYLKRQYLSSERSMKELKEIQYFFHVLGNVFGMLNCFEKGFSTSLMEYHMINKDLNDLGSKKEDFKNVTTGVFAPPYGHLLEDLMHNLGKNTGEFFGNVNLEDKNFTPDALEVLKIYEDMTKEKLNEGKDYARQLYFKIADTMMQDSNWDFLENSEVKKSLFSLNPILMMCETNMLHIFNIILNSFCLENDSDIEMADTMLLGMNSILICENKSKVFSSASHIISCISLCSMPEKLRDDAERFKFMASGVSELFAYISSTVCHLVDESEPKEAAEFFVPQTAESKLGFYLIQDADTAFNC